MCTFIIQILSAPNTDIYKFANFAWLYFQYFTTFCTCTYSSCQVSRIRRKTHIFLCKQRAHAGKSERISFNVVIRKTNITCQPVAFEILIMKFHKTNKYKIYFLNMEALHHRLRIHIVDVQLRVLHVLRVCFGYAIPTRFSGNYTSKILIIGS